MEHFRIKLSYFSLHAITSAIARPDVMWRSIIVGTVLCAALISVVSYISYAWASHTAQAILSPGSTAITVSRDEIREVLESYKEKEARFKALSDTPPRAPTLVLGTGKATEEMNIEDTGGEVSPESLFPDDGPQP